MRNHFAADLAEARKAVLDVNEAVLVNSGKVTGDVITVAKHLRSFLRIPVIAAHQAWALDQQHAWPIGSHRLEGFRVDHSHTDVR